MKELNAWRLALVYAGCFLGAGYLSGQELWQFFGAFGLGGLLGLALCTVMQAGFCIILLSLVRRGDIREIERVAVRRERRRLRAAIGAGQLVLLLGVTVIMSAGVGALTEEMLGRWSILASFLFCTVVATVARSGMHGLVSVFGRVIPVLIASALIFAAWTVIDHGWPTFALWQSTRGEENPLLPHWAVAAVSFVSCNLFGSIAILVPMAQAVPNARVARQGAVLGSLVLLGVAGAVLSALMLMPESVTYDLPMLVLAGRLHPAAGWLFAVLLLIAMFGTALSCTVAAREYLGQKLAFCRRHPTGVALVIALIAFVGGLFEFGDLIGWIYPIFGYLGFGVLCSVVAHERHVRRLKKPKEKP